MTLQSNRAKLNGDASAHPTIEGVQNMPKYLGGMTKRELIAMHCLQGMLANPQPTQIMYQEPKARAIAACNMADALLDELAK